MSNDSRERKISQHGEQGLILPLYTSIKEAGFNAGDEVDVSYGNGYVVVTDASADVPISEVDVGDRPNVRDTAVESSLEARIVGNRLFKMGERYEHDDHLKAETQELARRFHKLAENWDDE